MYRAEWKDYVNHVFSFNAASKIFLLIDYEIINIGDSKLDTCGILRMTLRNSKDDFHSAKIKEF